MGLSDTKDTLTGGPILCSAEISQRLKWGNESQMCDTVESTLCSLHTVRRPLGGGSGMDAQCIQALAIGNRLPKLIQNPRKATDELQ